MTIDATKFFYELTPDRILDAIELAGFMPTGRFTALNSMENRVYEVEIELDTPPATPSERFKIIKFYRPGRWSKFQIEEEHRFLLDLVENEIPVVAPLSLKDGKTISEMVGIFFSVFPKVGGRIPDELTTEQLQQVGRLLGRMHLTGRAREAKHRLHLSPQSYGLINLDFLLTNDILPLSVKEPYENTVKALCAAIEPMFRGVRTQRIHGDCHYGNLIWGSKGPFWVDFDDMVVGPPVQDLWLLVPGRELEDRILFESLLEGYEQMCQFERSTLRLIEPLRALRLINYSTWIAKRWQDPAFQRVFENFGTDRYWQEQIGYLREIHQLILESQNNQFQ
jgi:Ser/Thr protein kinase RdoA (MazF antagonist)